MSDGKETSGEKVSREGGSKWRQSQETGQPEMNRIPDIDKSGKPVAREGQNKGS